MRCKKCGVKNIVPSWKYCQECSNQKNKENIKKYKKKRTVYRRSTMDTEYYEAWGLKKTIEQWEFFFGFSEGTLRQMIIASVPTRDKLRVSSLIKQYWRSRTDIPWDKTDYSTSLLVLKEFSTPLEVDDDVYKKVAYR